jgi:hypothetical protein
LITPREWQKVGIAGGFTSTILSVGLSVAIVLDAISPIWLFVVLPMFLIAVFGGYPAYLIVHRTRVERAERTHDRPSAAAT